MAGRPKAELILSENEKHQLEAYTRRRKTSQAPALRLRIILECSGGFTNVVAAEKLGITQYTVGKWRTRSLAKEVGVSKMVVQRIWKAAGLQPHC